MSCGLPVVATDVNGISDIFDGGEAAGGIVVPSCDAIALAAALEQILTDKALGRKLGKRARRRAEACFSLEAVGRQLRNFLSIGESKDLLSAGEGTSTENIST
jgi:glycosyltransferase involved in cell wall biosynthesis